MADTTADTQVANPNESAFAQVVNSSVRRSWVNTRTFLSEAWLDILALCICGGICAAFWFSPFYPTHYIAYPLSPSGNSQYLSASFSYPYLEPAWTFLATAIICVCIPLLVLFGSQLWRLSFFGCVYAVLGFSYALVAGSTLQVILKKLVGGLRPHILAACRPRPVRELQSLNYILSGSGIAMFTPRQLCTTDKKVIAILSTSFPSGHSEFAFASMTFLSIYLYAHLGIGGHNRAGFWRMVLILTPQLLAVWIAASMVQSYHHFASDVWFGAVIGIVAAVCGYRMAFQSITNPERNCVPRRKFHEQEPVRSVMEGRNKEEVPV